MWAVVLSHPDYEVNEDGVIRNKINGRIIKAHLNEFGYERVNMKNPTGNRRCEFVHRIVLSSFYPPISKSLEVNHINGIKNDNRLINLEWVTRSENCSHSFQSGLRMSTIGMKKSKFNNVVFIPENNKWIGIFWFNKKRYRTKRFVNEIDAYNATLAMKNKLKSERIYL